MAIKALVKKIIPSSTISFVRSHKNLMPTEIIKDMRANSAIEKVRKKARCNPQIRVAFIVQMAEIWDKEAPIYEAMKKDPIFEADLIVIPPYNQEKKCVESIYDNSNFFLMNYTKCVRAVSNNTWIKLKEMGYDYVFLQRPYDHYLPLGFRSNDIVKFAKLCYVPYGFVGADVFDGMNTNKEFFRNVYFAFLESDYMSAKLLKKFGTKRERRNHYIFSCGYPALAPYFYFPTIEKFKTFTWTPRWSFDPVIGGSNFLKYKDTFVSVVRKHPEYDFVFRPHPLMFGEILSQGLMSKDEVTDYIFLLASLGVKYDKDTPLEDSLKNTDVLITDFSTIIIQFYLTGRPIVYCESCIEMNETYLDMKKGMYIVTDENDFIDVVDKLSNNNDYLYKERLKIINSGFSIHKNATNNIKEIIKNDYFGEGK